MDPQKEQMESGADEPAAAQLSEVRAEIFTEGIKQLVLVNGGGVVALLAFLQAVWPDETGLVRIVLYGIGWMLFGIVALLPIPFIRVLHSNAAQRIREALGPKADTRGKLWYLYNSLPYVSAIMFAVGAGQIVVSGLAIL